MVKIQLTKKTVLLILPPSKRNALSIRDLKKTMTLSERNGMHRIPLRNVFFALILIILSHSSTVADGTKTVPVTVFKPGEKLTYRATWGGITAGELVMEVLPMETIQGIKAYHFAMVTKTNEVVDLIYKVRQREESYIDIGMTHSILYKKQSGGKYPRDVVVNFDWEKLKATRSNFGEKMAPVSIVPGTFDTLSLFYVIRLHNLRENSVLEIPITEGDNNIIAKTTIAKREKIEIEGKTYDTFEVIPDMESLAAQKVVKKGDVPSLKIWLSDDDKKIPVKIQSKVKVGYFVFELVSVAP